MLSRSERMTKGSAKLFSQQRLLIFGGGIALVLFAVLGYLLFGPEGSGERALGQESDLRRMEHDESAAAGGGSPLAALQRKMLAGWVPNRKNLLAHYQLYFRYPHNSRPLNSDMRDLLDPFRIVEPPKPIYTSSRPGESDRPVLFVSTDVPMNVIVGDRSFVAHVTVKEPGSNRSVPFKVVSARILGDGSAGRVRIDDARYSDDGRDFDREANDHTVAFHWKATSPSRLTWGELALSLELKAEEQQFKLEVPFRATPVPAGKFTGRFEEKIENGSLVIEAEVDIDTAGYFQFAANLMHAATQRPSHLAIHQANLAAGRHMVPMLFFGKIFRDKDLDGKFTLTYLRGFRHNVPDRGTATGDAKARNRRPVRSKQEPLEQWMAPYMDSYTTKSYALDAFSDKEYEGEDKDQAITAAGDTSSGPGTPKK